MLMPAEAPGTPTRNSIGGRQRLLVESHGGVEHSRRVGGIDLQRRVVGGDDADAGRAAKVVGDGNRQGRALFRIGGRPEFVEQHQRMRASPDAR